MESRPEFQFPLSSLIKSMLNRISPSPDDSGQIEEPGVHSAKIKIIKRKRRGFKRVRNKMKYILKKKL